MSKFKLIMVAVFLLAGCDNPSIIGTWVQPVPGMEGQIQGIQIREGGIAKSVNMQTLQYKSWRQNRDDLILWGESIGNGQTINFEERYEIKKLSQRQLKLKDGETVLQFYRLN